MFRAGVEEHKFIFSCRGMIVAMQPRSTPEMRPSFESGRRKNATGVAEGNDRIGLAVMDEFGAATNGTVALFAKRGDGPFVHRHDFAGMNDLKRADHDNRRNQRGLDLP